MSSAQKIIQAAAGNAAGEPLYVEEVFSTYLYEGNGSTQTITNDIDLDGEGGLVWIKNRDTTDDHILTDTERGAGEYLSSNTNTAETTDADTTTSFNSDGFALGADVKVNTNTEDYVSWTFRKAPKFFDVVTYTGTGSLPSGTAQTIPHNLGVAPGAMLVKEISASGNQWRVYHRSLGATKHMVLNETTTAADSATEWSDTEPTSTEFTVGADSNGTNKTGSTYVAYLFAHNDGDGEFGEDADQDIIKCGSYTGNASSNGPEIDLGFEPQWVLIRNADDGAHWVIVDNMRGIVTGGNDPYLRPNATDADLTGNDILSVTSTGFKITDGGVYWNGSSNNHIYIAIRRGPMKTPESGTEVFAMDQLGQTSPTPPGYNSPFPVDLGIQKGTVASSWSWTTRLLDGGFLESDSTQAYVASSQFVTDFQNGFRDTTATSTDYYGWMFRRYPGFFDIVCYDGTGVIRTVDHNLGVVPEMMIVKEVSNDVGDWHVWHKEFSGTSNIIELNKTGAKFGSSTVFNSTDPTSSVFTVGTQNDTNGILDKYVAYLFATVAGVSKVGSYEGNGSSQTIDCGFTNGARFILIKNIDAVSDWYVFDSTRGIVAGNDPWLEFNTNLAQDSTADNIDPDSSGFIVNNNGTTALNTSGNTYMFLAIA